MITRGEKKMVGRYDALSNQWVYGYWLNRIFYVMVKVAA